MKELAPLVETLITQLAAGRFDEDAVSSAFEHLGRIEDYETFRITAVAVARLGLGLKDNGQVHNGSILLTVAARAWAQRPEVQSAWSDPRALEFISVARCASPTTRGDNPGALQLPLPLRA